MSDFVIPIFPFESTAITITATVWLGVIVAVFFNLRLGWTLSGLVVPGYLVPLILTRPVTAVVILVEAILTYVIVLAVSEGPRKHPYWSSFFGRDRFFVILLVSVIVRGVLDTFLLPWVGRIIVEDYGINFDYRNNLHSYGLIVVALIANYFWKSGVIRGLPPLATTVAITFVMMKFVVMRFTNFNVGNLELVYDDVTSSMMASPKAYIIILTTAYAASWMNLRYAWDFNGILIPALLGLMWHEPGKICMSIVECLMLYAVGSMLMKAPLLRKMTIQGARKLSFFFTICFVYRLIACHLLPMFIPDIVMTDAFGLGYLLTTLMAIKLSDKKQPFQLIIGTTQVSMAGAFAGSLIGFAFYCSPPIRFGFSGETLNSVSAQPRGPLLTPATSLFEQIRGDKTLLYENRKPESYQKPLASELNAFRNTLHTISRIDGSADAETKWRDLQQLSTVLHSLNYRATLLSDRYVYLHELSPARGWGIYVVDLNRRDGMLWQVPAPMDEWATIESGLSMFQQSNGRALAIAGSLRHVNFNKQSDMVNARDTMFDMFQQVFQRGDVIQVRAYTRTSRRRMAEAERLTSAQIATATQTSRIYIGGNLPAQLSLPKIKATTEQLEVRWNASPTQNRLRDRVNANVAELYLTRKDRRLLAAQIGATATDHRVQSPLQVEVIETNMRGWLGSVKDRLLQQGTDTYIPAKLEQMLYMDAEVFSPLMELLSSVAPSGSESSLADQSKRNPIDWLSEDVVGGLVVIDNAARAQGYQVLVINDTEEGESYVGVTEIASQTPKGWGAFVFRPGLQDTFAVEIPRPLFERRSFDFGVNLFERPRGSALLIAGAHPHANLDGSADISKPANRTNLFNLVRHVLLRHLRDRPLLITQARAIQAPVDADIVIATDDGARNIDQLTSLKSELLSQLSEDRLSVAFVDGSRETAGYELGILLQATSVQVSQNKEVVSLWLSPSLRTKFREQLDNDSLTAQFNVCGISTQQRKLTDYLRDLGHTETDAISATPLPKSLRDDLLRYTASTDVIGLLATVRNHSRWQFDRIVDSTTGQAFLAITQGDRFPTILNLTGAVGDRSVTMSTYDPEAVRVFVRSRSLWLEAIHEDDVASLAVGHGGES